MEQLDTYSGTWQSRTVACPNCSHPVPYYDIRKSAYFACEQCGAYFKREHGEEAQIIKVFSEEEKEPHALPLGIQALIYDKEYILVGHMVKKETGKSVYWNEYTFYTHAEDKYIVFSEFDGHWLFITPTATQYLFPDQEDYVIYEGVKYSLDLCYTFEILHANGEFDWNILADENLTAYEYVSPPVILINEKNGVTSDWYEAIYQSPIQVRDLLNLKPEQLAPRSGVLHFEPATFYPRFKPMMWLTAGIIIFLILFHFVTGTIKGTKDVFTDSYLCEQDTSAWGSNKPIVTPTFKIEGPAPVLIKFRAEIQNEWLELQTVLINDDNGKVYEVDKTIEYYSGYEGGESWSEGDREQEAIISGVPTGNYHMNIYPFNSKPEEKATIVHADPSVVGVAEAKAIDSAMLAQVRIEAHNMAFTVWVTQNVFLTSNLVLLLLIVLCYPAIQFLRKYSFERSKWFSKGYTTFTNENS